MKVPNFAIGGYWHCDKCGEEYHSSRHHTCEPNDGCRANSDGECSWSDCPQLRDNEPLKSSRHCPLDIHTDEEYL
jgi:hypothetical protein